jgi:hypothetical protein
MTFFNPIRKPLRGGPAGHDLCRGYKHPKVSMSCYYHSHSQPLISLHGPTKITRDKGPRWLRRAAEDAQIRILVRLKL